MNHIIGRLPVLQCFSTIIRANGLLRGREVSPLPNARGNDRVAKPPATTCIPQFRAIRAMNVCFYPSDTFGPRMVAASRSAHRRHVRSKAPMSRETSSPRLANPQPDGFHQQENTSEGKP